MVLTVELDEVVVTTLCRDLRVSIICFAGYLGAFKPARVPSRLVHKAIVHLHGFLASTRRRRQQQSMMAPAPGRMGTDGHDGAGSHATGSTLGQMPQAPSWDRMGTLGPGHSQRIPHKCHRLNSWGHRSRRFGCAKPVQIRTHSKTKETVLACAQFPLCATPWTLATWPDFPTCRGCGKHTVMRANGETQMVVLGCSQYPRCRATMTYPPSTQSDLSRCRRCAGSTFLWVNRGTQLLFIGCEEQTTCSTLPWPTVQLRHEKEAGDPPATGWKFTHRTEQRRGGQSSAAPFAVHGTSNAQTTGFVHSPFHEVDP